MALRDLLPSFAVVSAQENAGEEPELLAEQVVLAANGWALECIAARHGPDV